MNNYAVLGAGMMGKVAAKDLLDSDERALVTLVDGSEKQLEAAAALTGAERVQLKKVNVSEIPATAKALENHQVAISALPHSMSLPAIKAALEAKVSLVDLVGEAPDERAALHEAATEAGILIIPGCGVAPGISNICVGRGVQLLDETHNALIYVGGIPKEKTPPLNYQTVYLLESVFHLCLRPAVVIQAGKQVSAEALSGLETVEFPEPIGPLEAFYTDGVGSLPLTMAGKIKNNLFEKTLRYVGYAERFNFLKQCGLLDKKPVKVDDNYVAPFDFLARLLTPRLKLGPQGDILVMRVVVEGLKAGRRQQHLFELIDYFDPQTRYTAMARTTGFPASSAARMIAQNQLTEKGVRFPEQLFAGKHYEGFISELLTKGVAVTHKLSD